MVDQNTSTLTLYLDGSEVGSESLIQGEALDLLATQKWLMGGTNPVDEDYFKGLIDDLRFYGEALNGTEVATIANDDLSGAHTSG